VIARGENISNIAMTIRIMNIIKEWSGKHDLDNGSQMMLLVLENPAFKEEYVKRYGADSYKAEIERYSKSNLEKQREKQQRQEQSETTEA